LNDVNRVRATLNTRFDELLALQDRVSRLQVLVADMLSTLAQAAEEARNALLHLDSPPLWETLRAGGSGLALRAQLQESAASVGQALREWYGSFASQALLHALIICTLATSIILLRRRTRAWPREDPTINAAMHVLAHPIAAALLVGLMLTPTMYPRASVVIGELAALALIIPLLRLLPGLVYAPMRSPLYALAALYTLSRLHTLALPRSTLDRLMLLVVSVLALAGLLMLLRPGAPTGALSSSRWWRAAIAAARVAAVALTVAIGANVIGAVALAELLVESTLAGALIAASLLAVVLVIRGVIAILLRTRSARRLRMVSNFGPLIERRVTSFLHAAALFVWLLCIALLLNALGPVVRALNSVLEARLKVGTVDLSCGDILAFVAGIYASILVSRFIRFVLQEDVFSRLPLARGLPNTITLLVNYAVLGLGFLLAVAAAGFDLTRLTIIAGALGVGIGFGLQNVVNNFVSGLILAFERPVQIGDIVEVGQMVGEVKRIGIRSSTIRTTTGAEVIVPNAHLIANEVVNWTLSDRDRRLELKVGVAYGTDPARVLQLLKEVVDTHTLVSRTPAPIVTFDGFGDSSLNFTMRYWSKVDDMLHVGSDVAVGVYHALEQDGILDSVPAARPAPALGHPGSGCGAGCAARRARARARGLKP
jgi:potassium-dependent mechanosensitive channel